MSLIVGDNTDYQLNQLLNMIVENIASISPVAGSKGRLVFNTVSNVLQYDNGTVIKTIAETANLSNALINQGSYNASTNTPNILLGVVPGYFYTVSVAGNFLTKPLRIGDSLFYAGGNPSLLASYVIISGNVDVASTLNTGSVTLATQAETDACANSSKAVVPANLPLPYVSKTAAYTATTSDYFIDCTSGTFSVTAYTAVGNQRRELLFKNSGSGLITILTTSSELLDTVLSWPIPQGGWLKIKSDGTNWKIIDSSGFRATQISSVAISNSNVETSLIGTLVSTNVLPANLLKIGTSIRIKGNGFASRTSGNFTLNIKLGATTVCTTGVVAVGNGANLSCSFDIVITVRSIGATGTIFSQGQYLNSATNQVLNMANTTTTTIDTTVSKTVGVTGTFSTANASNNITLTNLIIEILN